MSPSPVASFSSLRPCPFFKSLGLAILFYIFIATPYHLLAGSIDDDYSWGTPAKNVEEGQISIQIDRTFAHLSLFSYDDKAYTGIAELDELTDIFGVYRIEKTYRMEYPPENPEMTDLSRYYTIYFDPSFHPGELIQAYGKCEEVVIAEFVSLNYSMYIPNDTRYKEQWHLKHCGFEEAWNVSHGSEDVVIGIVDSGIDMDTDGFLSIHEDLERNLWINSGEDIDNDGEITIDDWNGEDDDQNGYADDFYGWNFTANSNWPHDVWGEEGGHGTHVAGIASAVTDNETGVAGAAFSCKLMITAHYSEDAPDRHVSPYRGIEYCADNRADIINLSWGSLGRGTQSEGDAVRYAQELGCIIFAATGNDDYEDITENEQHIYPCAWPGVIGVGATDEIDRKADYSNYGDFTDLVAPGDDILSTFPSNSYTVEQGTSMACPLAVGLGALMLSVIPDLSSEELLSWMQRTSTDISAHNDRYPGIVHLINADLLLNSTHPGFELFEWSFIDIAGDGDDYLERGESFSINTLLQNNDGFQDAHNVMLTLSSNDPFINVTNGEISLGDLSSGESIQLQGDLSPAFRIRSNAPRVHTSLNITVTSDEGWVENIPIPVSIRQPLYLLVDDDGGDSLETYYMSDLSRRPYIYRYWDNDADGLLTEDHLNSYDFVIWFTGNSEHPLEQDEQGLLQAYLSQGGCLLLSGQFIGDDIGESEFHTSILHAGHLQNDTDSNRLFGNAENPITDGMSIYLAGAGGAGNGTISPSSMAALDGAVPIFSYDEATDAGGIFYSGDDCNLIYLGFALEAVSGVANTTERWEIIESVLDYFFELDVDPEETTPVIPSRFEILSVYPNPFNSELSFTVKVQPGKEFSLKILDLHGRALETIFSGSGNAGNNLYTWNGINFPGGIYFVRLDYGAGTAIRKAVLIK